MSRDHNPVTIGEFNGLWKRGDPESCPIDHFSDCNNIDFDESSFRWRDGLDTLLAKANVKRLYNYKLQSGESLLILDANGDIYHALLDGTNTVFGPILSIPAMTDFGFWATAGRAYITPFKTETNANGENFQRGLQNEFVYVYKGDGTAARKAAGNPPTNSSDTPLIAYNSSIDGGIDKGIHIIAIAYSNGVDRSTALGTTVLPVIYAPGGKQAIVDHLPIGPAGITIREIYMTKAIDPAVFDATAVYPFYFVTSVNDNTTRNKIINVNDADLTIPFAAGTLANPTSGGITAKNTNTDGFCDLGLHIIGVVYETDTGYLTAPGPEILAVQTFVNEKKKILIGNIPVSPDSFVTKRHLVASKAILDYNGDDDGFQLFFIPDGTLNDNVTTSLEVSFFDIDLEDDASHLIDNFASIPAGVTLTAYKGRMVLTTTYDNPSVAYLSADGEPEAIDQVDGLVIMPLDGNPMTNAFEFREVFYTTKKTRTTAWNDNGDVPSTWKPIIVDQGIGCSVHGVAQVLDSGGVNIDYILITDYSGIMIFDGAYSQPAGELTWKIADLWRSISRNDYGNIQIVNDSLSRKLYITLPDKKMLYGQYQNGLTFKAIKWTPWLFDIETTTIALINTNTLVIGSEKLM